MRPRQVLLDFPVTAKAAHGRELLLELGQDVWGQRRPFARRFFNRYQGLEPTCFIELEPRLDGMPVHGQQFCEHQPGSGLATD